MDFFLYKFMIVVGLFDIIYDCMWLTDSDLQVLLVSYEIIYECMWFLMQTDECCQSYGEHKFTSVGGELWNYICVCGLLIRLYEC